ncbi:MAG: AAA family ATPase [Mariniblastus sp.]
MKSKSVTRTTGMVLGKFMPPHLGHVYLFEFAKNYVDDLAIVVETQRDQPIPGKLRFNWVREMFPDVQVLHLTDENPQEPSEHPDFWKIWQHSLNRILPFEPDFLFASEQYGWKLAEVMNAKFIPVDVDRNIMPVSGTEVRNDPLGNWKYIPRVARPYFAKRICIFGPESTGKSTLCKQLAAHFETVYVPEYARTHIEMHSKHCGHELSLDDIPLIARGQMAAEDAIAFNANRVLFCDTDLTATTIWSEWLFKSCPTWIAKEADRRHYDLYLLTDVDVPWVDDVVRYLPEERTSFLERCKHELKSRNRDFVLLSGDWQTRFDTAVRAVGRVLANHSEKDSSV